MSKFVQAALLFLIIVKASNLISKTAR